MHNNMHAAVIYSFPAQNCLSILYCLATIMQDALLYGPRREKTCLRGFANNTGADQPAHPRSLISAFIIRFLESFMYKLASEEISIF